MTAFRFSLAACGLMLAGCATLGPEDCQSVDWFQLGRRDAYISGISSLEDYKKQCSVAARDPDMASYSKGWEIGRREKALWRY